MDEAIRMQTNNNSTCSIKKTPRMSDRSNRLNEAEAVQIPVRDYDHGSKRHKAKRRGSDLKEKADQTEASDIDGSKGKKTEKSFSVDEEESKRIKTQPLWTTKYNLRSKKAHTKGYESESLISGKICGRKNKPCPKYCLLIRPDELTNRKLDTECEKAISRFETKSKPVNSFYKPCMSPKSKKHTQGSRESSICYTRRYKRSTSKDERNSKEKTVSFNTRKGKVNDFYIFKQEPVRRRSSSIASRKYIEEPQFSSSSNKPSRLSRSRQKQTRSGRYYDNRHLRRRNSDSLSKRRSNRKRVSKYDGISRTNSSVSQRNLTSNNSPTIQGSIKEGSSKHYDSISRTNSSVSQRNLTSDSPSMQGSIKESSSKHYDSISRTNSSVSQRTLTSYSPSMHGSIKEGSSKYYDGISRSNFSVSARSTIIYSPSIRSLNEECVSVNYDEISRTNSSVSERSLINSASIYSLNEEGSNEHYDEISRTNSSVSQRSLSTKLSSINDPNINGSNKHYDDRSHTNRAVSENNLKSKSPSLRSPTQKVSKQRTSSSAACKPKNNKKSKPKKCTKQCGGTSNDSARRSNSVATCNDARSSRSHFQGKMNDNRNHNYNMNLKASMKFYSY